MANEIHIAMQQRGVLTLPSDLRKRYHLDRPGAQVHVVERSDGVIELHPELPVAADQVWFWTDRWQHLEREADADIAADRVATFDGVEDLLADLEA